MPYKEIFIRYFFLLCFLFSFILMFKTFSYRDGNILIGSNLWSDFASHIPLIRSFSFGWNFPVESPIFPGEPIHYHFLFYAFVGLLEKIGLPINLALNIPSALGFFVLLIMLYLFATQLFSSKAVGILTMLFFLFNGSFSFVYFLQHNPISPALFSEILTNKNFYSFAPYYGEGIVSAFWNLNIYTNQRHLATAFAVSLIIIYTLLRPIFHQKQLGISLSLLLGILLGFSFYFHIAVFMMTGIVIVFLGILFSKIRGQASILLIAAGIISLPQYFYMNSGGEVFNVIFKPGYLISDELTLKNFIWYWFMNVGLHSTLIILGCFFAPKNQKKVFAAFFSMFVIGNLFQFSPEMAANHKFFNYFLLVGNMFSAYVLVKAWKKTLLKPFVVIVFVLLIFSGIIDFFPVINDSKLRLLDYPKNPDIQWIIENTPPDAIFLNTSFLYTPESMAGRKIFLGWPYFAWSAGHNTTNRYEEMKNIFTTTHKETLCSYVKNNSISYISLTETSEDFQYNKEWFANTFMAIYKSTNTNLTIYDTEKNCN